MRFVWHKNEQDGIHFGRVRFDPKENVFAIRFNTASFDAWANKELTFHSVRTRHSFSLPTLVQVWTQLKAFELMRMCLHLAWICAKQEAIASHRKHIHTYTNASPRFASCWCGCGFKPGPHLYTNTNEVCGAAANPNECCIHAKSGLFSIRLVKPDPHLYANAMRMQRRHAKMREMLMWIYSIRLCGKCYVFGVGTSKKNTFAIVLTWTYILPLWKGRMNPW